MRRVVKSARAGKRTAVFAGAVTLVAAILLVALFWDDLRDRYHVYRLRTDPGYHEGLFQAARRPDDDWGLEGLLMGHTENRQWEAVRQRAMDAGAAGNPWLLIEEEHSWGGERTLFLLIERSGSDIVEIVTNLSALGSDRRADVDEQRLSRYEGKRDEDARMLVEDLVRLGPRLVAWADPDVFDGDRWLVSTSGGARIYLYGVNMSYFDAHPWTPPPGSDAYPGYRLIEDAFQVWKEVQKGGFVESRTVAAFQE